MYKLIRENLFYQEISKTNLQQYMFLFRFSIAIIVLIPINMHVLRVIVCRLTLFESGLNKNYVNCTNKNHLAPHLLEQKYCQMATVDCYSIFQHKQDLDG